MEPGCLQPSESGAHRQALCSHTETPTASMAAVSHLRDHKVCLKGHEAPVGGGSDCQQHSQAFYTTRQVKAVLDSYEEQSLVEKKTEKTAVGPEGVRAAVMKN
ncbi:Nuclear Rna Export Factor 3 [Manis pentadactyla]|nr:Nuclear Rna Export Factor 3 [Manis pentadactyla]